MKIPSLSRHDLILLFSFVSVISISLFGVSESFATYDIGIRHDKTCKALIAANDTWTCPSLDQIKVILPGMQLKEQYQNLLDDTTQDQGTQIKNNRTVELHAKSCILHDQCGIFEINPDHTARIWYDPSEFLSRSMDTITISANMKIKNPVHLKYSDITITANSDKREINFEINQLYVTDNCKDATFNPSYHDDWQYEISSLFAFMWKDCQNSKILSPYFDLNHTAQTDVTYFDPTTSPNYHYALWLESAKQQCRERC